MKLIKTYVLPAVIICTLMITACIFPVADAVCAEPPGEIAIECANGKICVTGAFEGKSTDKLYTVYLATYDEDNSLMKIDISKENWNLITVQQASGSSGIADTYSNLGNVVSWINQNKTNPFADLAWHMTWAYQQDSTLAEKFFSSAIFAREGNANAEGLTVIPNGSIIVVADGYQYCPDAWTSLNTKTSGRPGNVTKSIVIVDDAWWGNFNYRGFNICKNPASDISSFSQSDITNRFKIFVPVK